MKRFARFLIALFLVMLMILTASQVWASEELDGSVPTSLPIATNVPVPTAGPGTPVIGEPGKPINMGTASITPIDPGTLVTVTRVECSMIWPAPDGWEFLSDCFYLLTDPIDAKVQICYPYPDEFVVKQAKIVWFNKLVEPKRWDDLLDPIVENGLVCANSPTGYVALIGLK